MNERLKIVWLCTFSDEKLRRNLAFPKYYWGNIIRKIYKKQIESDFAIWDSNARNEFEKYTDRFEIHIIAPHSGISHLHEFEENGIYYHVFWKEWEILKEKIKLKYNKCNEYSFQSSRRLILDIIYRIKPDIVHIIGVENKFHSMAALDIPKSIPVIAQLQTLVSDERFRDNTLASEEEYNFNSDIEKKILSRANYIWTPVKRYEEIILKTINPNATILNCALMLTEPLNIIDVPKEYDFVYWALDVSKTADLVFEAFARARKKYRGHNIKLDVIGGYSLEYKKFLDEYLEKLGIKDDVIFEGKLPSHDDVLQQIRKSRFALLPLKIDIVSGTIREAMANGLPVVTTITPGTPKLNEKRECVLLSKTGDHQALANNMLTLLNDDTLAQKLRKNSLITGSEQVSNSDYALQWVKAYKSCFDNYKTGKSIPEELLKAYY